MLYSFAMVLIVLQSMIVSRDLIKSCNVQYFYVIIDTKQSIAFVCNESDGRLFIVAWCVSPAVGLMMIIER